MVISPGEVPTGWQMMRLWRRGRGGAGKRAAAVGETLISFAVANYNGERFLEDAVASALAQRGVDVEVLIVDDCSSDGSWQRAQSLADRDPRIRAWRLPENRGPGGARNLALDHARGDWLAVLDSDDLIHPDRMRRLVAEAHVTQATIVADDLLVFDDDDRTSPQLFLAGGRTAGAQWIDLPGYLRETAMYGRHPNLGFLKPVFQLDFLRAHALRYDDRLRIAEDDDLIVRALAAGARYRLLPEPMYFYRKHGTSISHRLSAAHADRMMAAADRLDPLIRQKDSTCATPWRRRRRALRRAWGFSHLVEALKRRDVGAAAAIVSRTPAALSLLRQPIGARAARLFGRAASSKADHAAPGDNRDAVLFISRQRLVGATNGSSAYLISLASAVRAAGRVPHLLQPSSGLFGRTPVLRLRPEMLVFETIRIRSATRMGSWIVTHDPAVFARAVRGILARLLRRVGVGGTLSIDRKAPYAIAAPWSRSELAFVATHGRGVAPIAIADYIFQIEALPYLLDSRCRTATVMHDLFSARADQFSGTATDSVAAIDQATEIDLLGRCDAVIAIQATEASFVADRVDGSTSVLAPMAADPVPAPQPGERHQLLFVGSNTAPNIHGLSWFVDHVWPVVRARAPEARLAVAGTVSTGIERSVAGVEMLGLVDDLDPLYARAGIVISPLLQGSGLKIKLVEALARGKACVVTPVTLQGVEAVVGPAVSCAEDAEAFAAAVLRLIGDDAARAAMAAAALRVARESFGSEAAYRGFRDWLGGNVPAGSANDHARI
ncbi:glycosyltransferase [Sphingomonas koreensis]|nr:glycosyltransferase [Sphingomonas koreensis]